MFTSKTYNVFEADMWSFGVLTFNALYSCMPFSNSINIWAKFCAHQCSGKSGCAYLEEVYDLPKPVSIQEVTLRRVCDVTMTAVALQRSSAVAVYSRLCPHSEQNDDDDASSWS